MPSLGVPELLIIGFIVTLIFGGPKIASLAKGLGDGMREFKKASREMRDAEREAKDKLEG